MDNLPTAPTATEIMEATPRTVEEWQDHRRQMKLHLEQLNGPTKKKRAAELILILEVASKKIDRFGWDRMATGLKDEMTGDWLDLLFPFTLAEVKQGVFDLFEASNGKLKSINEFQVRDCIRKRHSKAVALLPKSTPAYEPAIPIDAAERARRAAVVADTLGPGAVKRMPREQSEAQTQRNINAARNGEPN